MEVVRKLFLQGIQHGQKTVEGRPRVTEEQGAAWWGYREAGGGVEGQG